MVNKLIIFTRLNMMRLFFLSVFFFFGTGFAIGQKHAYIDSDYILSLMPEYTEAKDKLDRLAKRWTTEIEDTYAAIKKKRDNFNREEVLLPEEEKVKTAISAQSASTAVTAEEAAQKAAPELERATSAARRAEAAEDDQHRSMMKTIRTLSKEQLKTLQRKLEKALDMENANEAPAKESI